MNSCTTSTTPITATTKLDNLFTESSVNIPVGAIGIFDSGVGGLSIAKCIAEQLPLENIVYFADNQHAPYGDKSQNEIIDRVNQVSDALIKLGIKALVVACNTATVNAIDQLRKRYFNCKQEAHNSNDGQEKQNSTTNFALPIIGVEPAIKPATQLSQTKKVAVLATSATAKNSRFIELVERYKNNCEVIIQPCPGLVELIENNQQQSTECQKLLRQYISPLIKHNVDTLVLGCTHYPFLIEQIQAIVGTQMTIMETALPVTQQLIRQLSLLPAGIQSSSQQKQQNNQQLGQQFFFSSMPSAENKQLMQTLWQTEINC